MYLNNYQRLENKEIYLLSFLFLFSFLVRIPSIVIFGDTSLENEWGFLTNCLNEHGKLYSIFPFLIEPSLSYYPSDCQFNLDELFAPNLFMPPLYPLYLYFFKVFNFSNEIYILVVL